MKIFIGALVGGIIIFACQFLSWTVLDLHRPAQQYTPKQDSILSYLSTQFNSSGGYLLPNTPKGASSDDIKALSKKSSVSRGHRLLIIKALMQTWALT